MARQRRPYDLDDTTPGLSFKLRAEPQTDDNLCDAFRCRREASEGILPGATLLNPNRRVDLCEFHLGFFWKDYRNWLKGSLK